MTCRCGSPTPTGPCRRQVAGDADRDRCFMHDETGPPSSHGAPLDNTNAVENTGGGAPPLNTNAQIHGAFGDPQLVDARLVHADREYVDALAAAIAPRLATDADARELALSLYTAQLAETDVFERGLVLTGEDGHSRANPTVNQARLLTKRVVRELASEAD